ncbi:hypothetical protein QYE76_024544 [Lolium multiflorum]|uniref:Uncharacterized protein n=1 Tax=Lolium multiflorum TaxID=4521 RepID=A0AAD8RDI1_LOLMU|nr:hypothetical protein QYE76_024544 [Lolium multiflorum]
MYTDDTGLQFKFLNVYARLEHCEKWRRPELGQKKPKELKRTDSPADKMQASIDKCLADLRSHADGRHDKFDGRWREMLANQGARIALEDDGGGEEEEYDLAFPMGGGDMEAMDEETRNWYRAHRSDILRAPPASPSSSPPAPTSSTSPSTSSIAAATPIVLRCRRALRRRATKLVRRTPPCRPGLPTSLSPCNFLRSPICG